MARHATGFASPRVRVPGWYRPRVNNTAVALLLALTIFLVILAALVIVN